MRIFPLNDIHNFLLLDFPMQVNGPATIHTIDRVHLIVINRIQPYQHQNLVGISDFFDTRAELAIELPQNEG
jgi:hypothetical protein